MFGTLIESRPLRQRRRGSAALSAVVHVALVAGAVGATVHSKPPVEPPPVYHDTIVYVRPVALTGASADRPTSRCDACYVPIPPTRPVIVDLHPILDEGSMPHPNWDSLFTATSAARGTSSGPLVDNPLAHGAGVGSGTGVFTPNQVERAVAVLTTIRPAYPEMLRAAGTEGRVVVRFVVDTAGRVEPASITTVESTHALFERSVRDVLPRLRFAPAEAGGRHVRQLVEMPFQFSLSNR